MANSQSLIALVHSEEYTTARLCLEQPFPSSALSLCQQQILSPVNSEYLLWRISPSQQKTKAFLGFQHVCYKSTPILTSYVTLALLFKANLIVSQQ